MILVGDKHRELRFLGMEFAAQPANAKDAPLAFGDQRHLAVKVVETNPNQPFVRDPLAERDHMEIPEIDTLLRQFLVILHDGRLVFRPDRANRYDRAVIHFRRADVLRRVRPDRELRNVALLRAFRVQHHPRVESNELLRRREQRIDIDFLDPALLRNELAEAHEQLLQRRDIARGPAAHAFERREYLGAFHHPPRQRRVQRRQAERPILEHFHQLPARPEKQDRAELRIETASENQFVAVELDHRLHGHAEKIFRAHAALDRRKRFLHRRRIGEIEFHTADIGFVRYGFRMQLEHDRVANRVRRFRRQLFRLRDARLDCRNPVRREQRLRLEFRQDCAFRFANTVENLGCLRPVRRVIAISQDRRFIQQIQIRRVMPHIHERPRRRVRIRERRDAGPTQNLIARRHIRAAHPTRQHRLAETLRVRFQFLRRRRWIGHRLRRKNDEQTIRVRVFRRNLQRLRVAFRLRIAEHVDRVVVTPGAGQDLVQLLDGGRRNVRQLAAIENQRIRRQHARPTGIGEHRQPRPFRPRLFREHFGHVKHFGNLIHTQDTTAPERRFEHLITPSHRPGMRRRRFRRALRPPGFDHDDRLVQCHLARR